MKKIVFSTIIALNLATFAQASDSDVVSKIAQCYTATTNGSLEFKAQKSADGYDMLIEPKNKTYKMLLKKDAKIHLKVDEGPLITTPSFGFGKAGIVSSGNILDILSSDLKEAIDTKLKEQLKYKYEAKVSFGGELDSKTVFDAVTVDDNDTYFKTSKAIINSTMDIDSCIGKTVIKIDSIELIPNNKRGVLKIDGLELSPQMTEKPVGSIALFAKSSLKVDKLSFEDKGFGKEINATFSALLNGEVKRVDDKYLNLIYSINAKALDVDTIALAKGIKEAKFNFELDNSEIDGILELLKLSQKLEEAQDKMLEAKTDVERQKAIIEYTDLTTTKIVPIYNKIFVKDKTRLKLNLELSGDKTSFVKADLLYKADPVQDNMQSAMITLMAQNLAIVDGTIEIQVDKDLASSINPFALIGLDLLKAKGFATEKNGIYHLKAELKGGKIIINGKAYTLQELSQMSLQ